MKLYDTATQDYYDFQPGPLVRLYTCGITPYESAHLGHILTFMTYDLLQRRLEDRGHSVQLVRNITDVDEPIFDKAVELGIPYTELAKQETESFQSVLQQLNFRPAYAEPLASDYIADMSRAVETLLQDGYGYRLDHDIYFDTSKVSGFGKISCMSQQLQQAFMGMRGGDPERAAKRQPLDFMLWRGISDPSDPAAWETSLGRGRPGWHIECTIMSDCLLGTPFDLHGGGSDLIFPHHACEIAQSQALGKSLVAKHWLHVAPLSYLGEKMSKSLGNLVFAKDLLIEHEPATVRLALLHYHYRTGGEWQPEFLVEATELLAKLRTLKNSISSGAAVRLLADIRNALDDDLDTHLINHALCDAVQQPVKKLGDSAATLKFERALDLLGITL